MMDQKEAAALAKKRGARYYVWASFGALVACTATIERALVRKAEFEAADRSSPLTRDTVVYEIQHV